MTQTLFTLSLGTNEGTGSKLATSRVETGLGWAGQIVVG